ncbi:glycosyl hydrolase [Candidatus Poribacteria bacterium]|nr:glycosyl hydrolase [Candidatus Poribacteria bacterium]
MISVNTGITPEILKSDLDRLIDLAGQKIFKLKEKWMPEKGTPVFTVKGRYTLRGWTEWTQGFMYGMPLLHFDATGNTASLEYGRKSTMELMAPHLTHIGVHDHGFNNISTYGNLYRLMKEGKIDKDKWEMNFYELALKVSGAVQAARWTELPDNLGYICSFNGPHSLFIDTMRSLRILAVSHQLGHFLMGEQDQRISLIERLLKHAETTNQYCIYHGNNRDSFDINGRVVHESIFNLNSGAYRCPSTQQGYSPFSTWTRGLAWAICGYAEQLEFLDYLDEKEFMEIDIDGMSRKEEFIKHFLNTAQQIADFYIANTPTDGIPYWDTGAPNLTSIENYLDKPADPYNDYEPVDSSAASITAQGLIRLGKFLSKNGDAERGNHYISAGLTVAKSLFREPYISTDSEHEGLILHSVYHRPNGWDYIPPDQKIPCGESSMWGDYHALELAVLIKRMAENNYMNFFIK